MAESSSSFHKSVVKIGSHDARIRWALNKPSHGSLESTPPSNPKEAVRGTLSERVANNFTSLRLTVFQSYDYTVDRQSSGLVFNKITNREGGDHPERDITRLINPLRQAGIDEKLLPRWHSLGESHGTLLLTLQNTEGSWMIKGGGSISIDDVWRLNNVSFSIALPDEAVARELFNGIKQEPNTTLDTVMYRIFEPNGEGKYLPMERQKEPGVPRMRSNPFMEPIKQVLSTEIK